MKKFSREKLNFHLPESFKGLSKEYIMDCIFNEQIQKEWKPQVGDIIATHTGNVFVISGEDRLHKSLGGTSYYFGGGSCNRDGGNILDSTFCFTANEVGKYIHPLKGEQDNPYHSSIREFRFVPYPHELGHLLGHDVQVKEDISDKPSDLDMTIKDISDNLRKRFSDDFDIYVKVEGDTLIVEEYWYDNGCKNDDDCYDRARELGEEIIELFPSLMIDEYYCHRHKYAIVNLKLI